MTQFSFLVKHLIEQRCLNRLEYSKGILDLKRHAFEVIHFYSQKAYSKLMFLFRSYKSCAFYKMAYSLLTPLLSPVPMFFFYIA